MTVVQITFGEIPSALTWMAQDLHINKIQMIRLLLRKLEIGENVAKDYPCFEQQRGKKGVRKYGTIVFMVAITYNKGVVMCEEYEGSISGSKFATLCDNHFPQAFMLVASPHDK